MSQFFHEGSMAYGTGVGEFFPRLMSRVFDNIYIIMDLSLGDR